MKRQISFLLFCTLVFSLVMPTYAGASDDINWITTGIEVTGYQANLYESPATTNPVATLTGNARVSAIGKNASGVYYYRLTNGTSTNYYVKATDVTPDYDTLTSDFYTMYIFDSAGEDANTKVNPSFTKFYKLNGEMYCATGDAVKLNSLTVSVKDSSGTQVTGGTATIDTAVDWKYAISANSEIAGKTDFSKLTVGNRYTMTVTAMFVDYYFPVTSTSVTSAKFYQKMTYNFTLQPGPDSTLSISGHESGTPSGTLTQGEKYYLRGVISSNYTITNIEAHIYNSSDGDAVKAYNKTWNSTSYNIKNDGLDSYFKFGTLAEGSYRYVVKATDASGTTRTLINSRFSIAVPIKPEMPIVSVTQSQFEVGDSIVISWTSAARNEYYWINVFRNDSLIVDKSMGTSRSYTLNNAQAGSYLVYVSANNNAGTSGSSSCVFTVSTTALTPAKTITYEGRSYERYDNSVSWTTAKAACEERGGHLVSITSVAENNAVIELMSGSTKNYYHIGLINPTKADGAWSWVTGESFYYENWDKDKPEPSKGDGEYYAAIIAKDYGVKSIGEWIDEPDNGSSSATSFFAIKNSGFICEYEDTSSPTVTEARIVNLTTEGYDITVNAIDNKGVTRIQLGTWNDSIGINAAKWQTFSVSSFPMVVHVSFSDFDNLRNTPYHTNVYAFDAAGNTSSATRAARDYDLVTAVYSFDVNGMLDGMSAGNLGNYGTFDLYLNEQLVAQNVNDYSSYLPMGTYWEIKNIRPSNGHAYEGLASGNRAENIVKPETAVLSFHTVPSSLQEEPIRTAFNGHSYLYYLTPVTWYDAKELCEKMGGHLVTVTSAEENAFLYDLIGPSFSCWIGATDKDSEGMFTWITGEPFSYTNWNRGTNEPSNGSNNDEEAENYVHIIGGFNGAWNDIASNMMYGFICEFDREISILTLPANLLEIEEEAFSGIAAEWIVVPDGCQTIARNAFSGCPNLKEISIPSTCIIADGAVPSSVRIIRR